MEIGKGRGAWYRSHLINRHRRQWYMIEAPSITLSFTGKEAKKEGSEGYSSNGRRKVGRATEHEGL